MLSRQQKEMIVTNVLGAHRIIEVMLPPNKNIQEALIVDGATESQRLDFMKTEKRCICGKSPAQLGHLAKEIISTLERFEKLEKP